MIQWQKLKVYTKGGWYIIYNKALDTFKAVADSGSFTKASEQLFISHTAVIKQINGLESHLGVKLFRRSNQGVVMTPAGQCLYAKTIEVMHFSAKAVQEIQETHFSSPKTIRVGTSLFYPCHIFMNLWNFISDRFPQYQLKIVSIEDDEQRFAGLNDAYDFLVCAYNSEAGGTVYPFIPIGEYHFCLSMPLRHPLAKEKSLSFEDLSGQQLMIMKRGYSKINDSIRAEIESNYPNITLIDILPHYSIRTFNHCIESNAILLSLECWKEVHPGLITIPLNESYTLPYGILTAPKTEPELDEFICALQECLEILLHTNPVKA